MLLDLDPFWNIPLMPDHFFNDPRLIYSVRIPEALCGVSEWEPGGPIISLIRGITLRVKSIIEDCDEPCTAIWRRSRCHWRAPPRWAEPEERPSGPETEPNARFLIKFPTSCLKGVGISLIRALPFVGPKLVDLPTHALTFAILARASRAEPSFR